MENMKLKMSRGNAGKKREEKIFKYVVLVAQSCLTLCDPMDVAHQAPLSMGISSKKLEWIAIPIFRGSFWPRDRTRASGIAGRFFTIWSTREAPFKYVDKPQT